MRAREFARAAGVRVRAVDDNVGTVGRQLDLAPIGTVEHAPVDRGHLRHAAAERGLRGFLAMRLNKIQRADCRLCLAADREEQRMGGGTALGVCRHDSSLWPENADEGLFVATSV